jgi:phosphoglycolate phosphatase-like HAD superfamily hydrolase
VIRKARHPLYFVLFDLDGTLIDSTELIVDSYAHTYRTHGRVMSTEQIQADLGMPLHDTLARHFTATTSKQQLPRTSISISRATTMA